MLLGLHLYSVEIAANPGHILKYNLTRKLNYSFATERHLIRLLCLLTIIPAMRFDLNQSGTSFRFVSQSVCNLRAVTRAQRDATLSFLPTLLGFCFSGSSLASPSRCFGYATAIRLLP